MAAKPGWYDDGSGRSRWWNGKNWSDSFRDDADAPTAGTGNGAIYNFVSHIEGKNANVSIFDDRIEWSRSSGISAGKITAGVLTGGASLLVTGMGQGTYRPNLAKGSEIIRLSAVTGISSKRDGLINTIVSVTTPSMVLAMRVHHDEAQQVARVLNDLIGKAQTQNITVHVEAPAAQTTAAAPDHLDQLQKLGSLRDAGVLTEEEFAEQKAAILARM
jgi:hypothetical protein